MLLLEYNGETDVIVKADGTSHTSYHASFAKHR